MDIILSKIGWLALLAVIVWHGFSIWMLYRFSSGRSQRPWLLWPIQMTFLTTLSALLIAQGYNEDGLGFVVFTVGSAMFPPALIAIALFTDWASDFSRSVVLVPALAGFAVGGLWRKTSRYAPIVAFFFGGLGVLAFGNSYWDQRMCISAAENGLTNVQRETFLSSLSFQNERRGTRAYALAYQEGQQWHWSYFNTGFHKSRVEMTLVSEASSLMCGE